MTACDVTIAIPTKNGGVWFSELLVRLAELDPRPSAIAVIDSSSTDGTAEAARAAGCRVQVIPVSEFDHGSTRQRLAEEARTEFVAFLTQDALPARDYLRPLVAAMADPRTAAACARIVPRADASPLAKRTVLDSPAASAIARVAECDSIDRRTPAELASLVWLDDVASCYRREALLALPFPRTMMGEDAEFALSALRAGWRIRFVPESIVEHSHEYTAAQAFRRYRDDAAFALRRFGRRLRPGLSSVARGIGYEVVRDWRYLSRERPPRAWREAMRSPWLRSWQVIGQWRGSRGAENL